MTDTASPVTIEGLGRSGDGLARRPDGSTVYIPFALPGEVWDISDADNPHCTAPRADRQPARCPHYGPCGGCMAQHMPDDVYVEWKHGLVVRALRHHGLGDATVDPLVRIAAGSRRRTVLTAERTAAGFTLGFHGFHTHAMAPIRECAVLLPAIVSALPHLARLAETLLPGQKQGRLSVLATDTGLDVAVLPPVTDPTAEVRSAAARVAEAAGFARVSVGSTVVVARSRPEIRFADVVVVPPPITFVQAVSAAETVMRDLVLAGIGKARNVADLFAGLGTFTLPLARTARVLAVDSDREALESLDAAVRATSRLKPVRTLRRDLMQEPLSPRELADFDAVVFDPPRAGARDQAQRIARSTVKRVVAVSCNPDTLAQDLAALVAGGFRLHSVTPIDQFVFSAHVEAVAVLSRR